MTADNGIGTTTEVFVNEVTCPGRADAFLAANSSLSVAIFARHAFIPMMAAAIASFCSWMRLSWLRLLYAC
ncbi:hypothetical protein ABL78_8361 [Leptomonas seymouri]|uniref:Uncharacterized protein n=1 Tax=Leptomonas seymouri TaxID=5684 RepID=A0A0N1I0P9_LEPSE|nr:hypothetical protein ABL78_8361 [Leptomonas seymouri]|eukprot:KPI82630.1 hypothetical protein ABL78_8361 [Leptomonas seymouri]